MSDDIVKTLLESLTDEQKSELVKSLMKSEKEEPEQREEVVSSDIEVNEDFTVTRKINESTRRNPVKARKNKWVDDGSFQLEGEEEFSSDRKRSSRNRGKTKKVQLECSVCGKTYMEHPSLVYGEYHRCNRCGGK